jgi:hypothetical protein
VARESFQFGPQSPNLPIFGLIFDGNNIKIGKNSTNLTRECFGNTFLARIKFELCIPALDHWFSTYGRWRPTKQNKRQFADPFITIIILKHRVWRPKGINPRPVEKHCSRLVFLNPLILIIVKKVLWQTQVEKQSMQN